MSKNPLVRTVLFLAVTAVIWSALLVFVPSSGQDSVFFFNVRNSHFLDYFWTRTVSSMANPYLEDAWSPYVGEVARHDQCYPALVYQFVGLFPDTPGGAFVCSLLGTLVYFTGVWTLLRRFRVPTLLPLLSLLVSVRVMFSFEVGNPIFYAAGATCFFFAWYDSDNRILRLTAALALASASVMKITPAMLGLAYLLPGRKIDWRGPIVSAVAFLVLFLLPFASFGGADGFLAWMANASGNSAAYAWRNSLGLYGLVSSSLDVLGFGHKSIHLPLRILSSSFAVLLIVRAFLTRGDRFARLGLLTLGMLFFPPTMMTYTMLYVVPLLIVGTWRYAGKPATSFAICWAACNVPLQIPLLFGSLNRCLMPAAMLDVCYVLWRRAGLEEPRTTECGDDGAATRR